MSRMDKKTVIFGGDTEKVSVDRVSWSRVEEAIQKACGEDVKIVNLSDAKKTVAEARKGKSSAKTYVKIGLVGNDLVMRVKTPGVLKDTEVDTILVKGGKKIIAKMKSESDERRQAASSSSSSQVDKSVQEAAAEHLELRKSMVDATSELLLRTREAISELQKADTAVQKHRARMKDEGLSQKLVLVGVVEQLVAESRERIVAIQKEYKGFTRSGSPLMESRRDFGGVKKLPEEEQDSYKAASGKFFRQASKTMEAVADNMNTVAYLGGSLQEGLELAQAVARPSMSPVDALVRLGDIRNDLEPLKDGIERRYGKLTQVLDRNNSVWTTVLTGSEELKPQRIRSYEGKVEEIEKLVSYLRDTKEPLKHINSRLTAIPGEAMSDREVAKAADELRKEATALRTALRNVPGLLSTWSMLKQDARSALDLD